MGKNKRIPYGTWPADKPDMTSVIEHMDFFQMTDHHLWFCLHNGH